MSRNQHPDMGGAAKFYNEFGPKSGCMGYQCDCCRTPLTKEQAHRQARRKLKQLDQREFQNLEMVE